MEDAIFSPRKDDLGREQGLVARQDRPKASWRRTVVRFRTIKRMKMPRVWKTQGKSLLSQRVVVNTAVRDGFGCRNTTQLLKIWGPMISGALDQTRLRMS
jgi:hypothetical protein